jgi:hypothetical protein
LTTNIIALIFSGIIFHIEISGEFVPNDHRPVKGKIGMMKFFQRDMSEGETNIQVIIIRIMQI